MTQLASMGGDTAADQDTSGAGDTRPPTAYTLDVPGPLDTDALRRLDAWWRAASYLSVGQIYLKGNPLLRTPLLPEHIKARLLGHFGTVPGLNLVYAHANRLIVERDLNAVFVAGPGTAGRAPTPALGWRAPTPNCSATSSRTSRAWPRSSPSSPPRACPAHARRRRRGRSTRAASSATRCYAYGAALDSPDLIVFCVVGDGEAETGPLAGSWHSAKFLDPARDGAVLPILALNEYKIANPTLLARIPAEELETLMRGYGFEPHHVVGDDPTAVHQTLAATMATCLDQISAIQQAARAEGPEDHTARWPMIILSTPKGWTGPPVVDGQQVEGTFRAHQVPLPGVRQNPEHREALEPGCGRTGRGAVRRGRRAGARGSAT